MGKPDYSVIILTWNSKQHVQPCLESLREAAPGYVGEVIVIDNGSKDGTPDLVAQLAPQAHLIRNTSNRGVAAARNQGLILARAPIAILLDVDAIATPGSFSSLIEYLRATPSIGVCGPRLLLPDGTIQASCQLFPTAIDKVVRQLPRRLADRLLRKVELRDWDHRGIRDVDYVVGACQAIRMAALSEVGWLDERIFYGPEDVDFCIRMRLKGWRVTYLGDVMVRHECQRVTRRRLNALTVRHVLGLARLFRTHGYLISRRNLYRRIAWANAAKDAPKAAAAVPGQSALGLSGNA